MTAVRFFVCTTVVLVLTTTWWLVVVLTATCFTFVPCAPFFTTVTDVVVCIGFACLCTITCVPLAEGELECPSTIEAPAASTTRTSPTRATSLICGLMVRLTTFPRRRRRCGATSAHAAAARGEERPHRDSAARPVLHRDPAADRRRQTEVGGRAERVAGRIEDERRARRGRQRRVVLRRQGGQRDVGVTVVGRADRRVGVSRAAGIVVVRVRVDRTHRLGDVLLRRGLVRPVLQGEVGRERDRQKDAEDQHHDRELDEREAFLAFEAALHARDEVADPGRHLPLLIGKNWHPL